MVANWLTDPREQERLEETGKIYWLHEGEGMTMGRFSEYGGESQYLRGEEIAAVKGPTWVVRVTIREIRPEQMPDRQMGQLVSKLVCYFQQFKKGLVLNQCNREVLAQLFGDETENCHGKEVVFFLTPVQMDGRTVPGMRLRGVEQSTEAGADEIPF